MAMHNPTEDALAVLLNLQQTDPLLSAPRRPFNYDRNQAKVASLRKFLGIPGEDVGDISQQDYEEAAADVERRQQEQELVKGQATIAPEIVRGEYGVRAAEARAGATERLQREQQERRQTFQAEEGARNRAAMSERQQTALRAPVVPTLDPDTGLAEWTPRVGAAGMRTGGSATEREAIQGGANTLGNIANLIKMGDDIGWQGVGPTGGVRNLGYKLFGVGSEAEDNLRVELQKVRADIMFGSGGKQLTTSEQKVAAGYLSDIYTNPRAARSRLLQVQQLFERAQARRMGRPVPAPNTDTDWEDVR